MGDKDNTMNESVVYDDMAYDHNDRLPDEDDDDEMYDQSGIDAFEPYIEEEDVEDNDKDSGQNQNQDKRGVHVHKDNAKKQKESSKNNNNNNEVSFEGEVSVEDYYDNMEFGILYHIL